MLLGDVHSSLLHFNNRSIVCLQISGALHAVLDKTGSSSMNKLTNFQINSTARSSMSEGVNLDTEEQTDSIHRINQVNLEDESINENGQIDIKVCILNRSTKVNFYLLTVLN
jgi:hypothetical protein